MSSESKHNSSERINKQICIRYIIDMAIAPYSNPLYNHTLALMRQIYITRHPDHRCKNTKNIPNNDAQVFHTNSGPGPELPVGLGVAAAAVVVVAFSEPPFEPLEPLEPLAGDLFLSSLGWLRTRLPMLFSMPYSSTLGVTSERE